LEGEARSKTLRHLVDVIVPKQSIRSFYSDIPDVDIQNIRVGPCIWSRKYPNTSVSMASFNFRQYLLRLSSETNDLAGHVFLEENGCWFIDVGARESTIVCWCGKCGSLKPSQKIKRQFSARECGIVYRCWKILRFNKPVVKLLPRLVNEWRTSSISNLRKKLYLEGEKKRPSKLLIELWKDRIRIHSSELNIPPILSGLQPTHDEVSRIARSVAAPKKTKSTASFCKCTSGKCNSCVCKRNNRPCNSRCHNGKHNSNCRLISSL